MPFLEQQQSLVPQLFKVDRLPACERMTVRQGHFEGVTEQDSHLDIPAIVGEGKQHDVEPACVQLFDKPRRQVLDEIEPQSWIGAAQPGQNVRQQKRADSRDHTHPESSAERLTCGPCGFHEIFAIAQHLPRPLDNFVPERGQQHAA